MKFTRDNYEEFVLDFLEGRLSEKEHSDFMLFLKNNPDLDQEISDISNIHLRPEETIFQGKGLLKKAVRKSEYEKDFEKYCVADLEGDLELTEKLNFENWVSVHPEKRQEFEIFRKAYLKADMSIVFSPKSRLKRLSLVQKRIRAVSLLSAIAAMILVIFILIRPSDILNRRPLSDDNQSGENHSVKKIENSFDLEGVTQKAEENSNQIAKKREHETGSGKLNTENAINDSENLEQRKGRGIQDENKQEQIIHKRLPVTGDQQSTDHRETGNADQLPTDNREPGTDIRQPVITPVTPMLAYIENDDNVSYSELKGISDDPDKDYDTYQTVGEFAGQKILKVLFPQYKSAKKEKITIWDLASSGIKGLNNLTDEGGYILDRETNNNGEPERISFETPLLGLSVPVKNKDSQ